MFPRTYLTVASLLLATSFTLAQSASTPTPPSTPPAKPLAFEVASIRPHQGPLHAIMDFSSSGPRVRLGGYNLRGLIMEAYGLRNYQISIEEKDERTNIYYDIAATAAEDTTPTREEFRRMLQSLLAERFQLKAHFEKKQTPVYALVLAKGGPKLEPSTDDGDQLHGVNGRNQFFRTSKTTMNDLADAIWDGFMPDRPVIDRTGLTGTYKLRVEATPNFAWAEMSNPATSASSPPSKSSSASSSNRPLL